MSSQKSVNSLLIIKIKEAIEFNFSIAKINKYLMILDSQIMAEIYFSLSIKKFLHTFANQKPNQINISF
jgi:hypothetical protein